MNYELCKKLKEAGFPQDWEKASAFYDDTEKHNLWTVGDVDGFSSWKDNPNGSGYHTPSTSGCGCCSYDIGSNVSNFVQVPTLSQLIESCGDKFEALIKQAGGWVAISNMEGYMLKQNFECVPTPEEAVANLWLKLAGCPQDRT